MKVGLYPQKPNTGRDFSWGKNVWAEWWHPCMSQMKDSDDWVSTITNINISLEL